MKRVIALAAGVAVATAYFVVSALPAFSADSGTVNVKLTVATPCITVGPSTGIDFTTSNGALEFSPSASNPKVYMSTTLMSVSNCGSTANVYVKGTNATSSTSSATWTLVEQGPVAKNVYHAGVVGQSPPASFPVFLSPTTSFLYRLMPAGATDSIAATLDMALVGSDGAGETMSFQISYTATL
jgi:hypothetical protein